MNNIIQVIRGGVGGMLFRMAVPRLHIPRSLKIQGPYATLSRCEQLISNQCTGAYMRFGDGDIYLMLNRRDLLQRARADLAKEMKEAFELNGNGIVKALPLESERFGYSPGMKLGTHLRDDRSALMWIRLCASYFIGTPIYSSVALHYVAEFDRHYAIEFINKIYQNDIIFVGNEKFNQGVVDALLKPIVRIDTPSQDAYSQIDTIEQGVMRALDIHSSNFNVVLTAMGCAGRVLAKRLLMRKDLNIFVFDFGSLLDALCGWESRKWISQARLGSGYWDEFLEDVVESRNEVT